MTVGMLQNSQKLVKMLIADYLIEFDHLYHKMTDQRLQFPIIVLIFKLLESSNFNEGKRKSALYLKQSFRIQHNEIIFLIHFYKIHSSIEFHL